MLGIPLTNVDQIDAMALKFHKSLSSSIWHRGVFRDFSRKDPLPIFSEGRIGGLKLCSVSHCRPRHRSYPREMLKKSLKPNPMVGMAMCNYNRGATPFETYPLALHGVV